VVKSKKDYHLACKMERTATNQENNARNSSEFSADQVYKLAFMMLVRVSFFPTVQFASVSAFTRVYIANKWPVVVTVERSLATQKIVRISASPLTGNSLGQAAHTHVPLSPSSIWYRLIGGDVFRLGR